MTGSARSSASRCFAAAAEGKIKAQIEKLLPLSRAVDARRLDGHDVLGPNRADEERGKRKARCKDASLGHGGLLGECRSTPYR
jgi:hypothetical protein